MATEQSDGVLGYEVIFDGETDRKYTCPICLVVMRDAMQTSCGHRFCKECILKVANRRSLCKCPVDNTWFDIEHEMFPDIAVRREILSLRVKCNQVPEGCLWTGELRSLEVHISACEYIEIQCEYGCSQGRLLRGDFERHKRTCENRPDTCEHCCDVMPSIQMTRHQLLDCKMIPLSCTQCGQAGIQRGEIQQHLDAQCPKVLTVCRYMQYGCNFQDKREKMDQHDRDAASSHLLYMEKKLQGQERRIAEMDKHTNSLTSMLSLQRIQLDEKSSQLEELQHTSFNGRLHWKVTLTPGLDKYESRSFYTGSPGYKLHMLLELRGHVERNQTYASLFVILEKGQYDDELFFPLNAKCKAKVLSESATVTEVLINCVNIPRCLNENEVSNRQPGRLRFMPTDSLLSEDFCTDNNIYIDIKVKV